MGVLIVEHMGGRVTPHFYCDSVHFLSSLRLLIYNNFFFLLLFPFLLSATEGDVAEQPVLAGVVVQTVPVL